MNNRKLLLVLLFILPGLTAFSQSPDCQFSEITATVSDCMENDSFLVSLAFDVTAPGDQGFQVRGNGVEYGNFEYGNEHYTIGPLPGDCRTLYEFVLIDNTFPDCRGAIDFEDTVCCIADCSLEVYDINLGACDSLGYRKLEFQVDHSEVSTEGFEVLYYEIPIGHFNYDSGPYLIEVPGSDYPEVLTIRDKVLPDCEATFYFINEPCTPAIPCAFDFSTGVVQTTREFECTSDSSYYAYAQLSNPLGIDSVWLSFFSDQGFEEGLLWQRKVSTSDFPQLLGEFFPDNTLYYYFIHDASNVFCSTGSEWNDAPDCSGFEACPFSDITIETGSCSDSGDFTLQFSFQTDLLPSVGFTAEINEMGKDTFPYGQLLYTSSPIGVQCDRLNVLVLSDLESGCTKRYNFNPPDCCNRGCTIDEIQLTDFDCHDDGSYSMLLDFDYTNVTNDYFDVFAGDRLVGYFRYADLPVRIDSFYGRDGTFDLLKICDNDNPDCCAIHEFRKPECEDDRPDCRIYDVFAESYDCTNSGTFMLDFEFNVENPGAMGFLAKVNGELLDSFNYGQVFYTMGPVPLRCDSKNYLVIYDIEKKCIAEFVFDKPDCCAVGSCNISEISVGEFDCNDNGTYGLLLDFDYNNETNTFFDVWAGNTFVGYYAYSELPVWIEEFQPRDVEYDIIKICDNDNPNCCNFHEFMGPVCDSVGNICPISNADISEIERTSNGDIHITTTFDVSTDVPIGLDVYVNGEFLYFESDATSPLNIVYRNGNTDRVHVKLCLNDTPDCCIESEARVSNAGQCALFDLEVFQTVCKDGFYYLVVDAEHGFGEGDRRFSLRGNGNNYGDFAVSQLPVAIGPFHMDELINELVLRIAGIEDCFESTEIDISCDCTSNIIEIDSEEFSITETGTDIIIESPGIQSFSIEMYALDGRLLLHSQAQSRYTVSKLNYQTGIYVLKINYRGTSKSFKLFMSD